MPPLRRVDLRRAQYRQRLAQAIEEQLPSPRLGRVAVAGIDNSDELGSAVARAAAHLADRGGDATVLDVTEQGSHQLRRAASEGSSSAISVLRPRGLPALARDAADLLPIGQWDEGPETPGARLGDVTLVLADLDPAVGADHLATWADRIIVVVTAGRTSVEKIRAVGDMVRAAGLDLRFAVVLHTERSDDSSGQLPVEQPVAAASLSADENVAVSAGKSEAR
jgi:hypothetical protein